MATKKINAKAITPVSIEMLSNFKKSSDELRKAREVLKDATTPLKEKIAEQKKLRDDAIKGGMNVNDALVKFPTLDEENAIELATKTYKDTCKPLNEERAKAYKCINPNFYYAYKLAFADIAKISYKATGDVVVSEKSTVKIDSKNTFYACIKEFFATLGFKALDDEKAMTKAVDSIVAIIGGMKVAKKEFGLECDKALAMKEKLYVATIEYLIARNILEETEDGGLQRKEGVEMVEKATEEQNA